MQLASWSPPLQRSVSSTMLPPTVLLVSHCPDCYFASFLGGYDITVTHKRKQDSNLGCIPDYHTVLFHKHPCTVHTNALTFLLSRSTHTHTYLHVCMYGCNNVSNVITDICIYIHACLFCGNARASWGCCNRHACMRGECAIFSNSNDIHDIRTPQRPQLCFGAYS